MAGISINGATHKRDALLAPLETKLSGLEPKHPFRHIISLMHEANVRAGEEIYSESDVLFDVKIVTTNRHNRKGGLGTDLLRRSFRLAQILDFKGCKTEATGEQERSRDHIYIF